MRMSIFCLRRRRIVFVGILFPCSVYLFCSLLLLVKIGKPTNLIGNERLIPPRRVSKNDKDKGLRSNNLILGGRQLDTRKQSLRFQRYLLNLTNLSSKKNQQMSARDTVQRKEKSGTHYTVQYTTEASASTIAQQHSGENIFIQWRQHKRTYCDGKAELFPEGHFVSFRDAIFRKELIQGKNLGGEEMSKVMRQPEDAEYFIVHKGFFSLPCRQFPSEYRFPSNHESHLNEWLANVIPYANESVSTNPVSYIEDFTIIVKRYEYVNLYHSMTDFYNAFLVMRYFQKSPHDTKILFFDAHPKGSLDSVWTTMFNSASRVSQLKTVSRYKHAVWNSPGYESPMYDYDVLERIPLIEDFHRFFLNQHGILTESDLDCKRLRLVVIWRRDYVAHPRNPSGNIERKIWNEKELLDAAKNTSFFSSVIGVQLDKMAMKRQLSLIANADILAGMHGAGLTHTLFLPSHGGLIELFPSYFPELGHFKALARWRNLHYLNWINEEAQNEKKNKRTRIPPSVFTGLLAKMRKKLCP